MAGCDRAGSCRQCEFAQEHNRAGHRILTQSQRSIRALHKEVRDGIYRVKHATQCQQPPVFDQRLDQANLQIVIRPYLLACGF